MVKNEIIQHIIDNAASVAKQLNHEYVSAEHIAYSLINYNEFKTILVEYGCDWDGLNKSLKDYLNTNDFGNLKKSSEKAPILTKFSGEVLLTAAQGAIMSGRHKMETMDLFIALASASESHASYFFEKFQVGDSRIVEFFSKRYREKTRDNKNEYVVNLNELAKKGKIDPVIGRDQELSDLCQILCRRNKANVLMVGDPGVGKTAIAEGLANRIVNGNVPKILKDSIIFNLDIGKLLAGSKFRGEFEGKVKEVFEDLEKTPGSILFIDEAHVMRGAGAGGEHTGPDFSQMIKPYITKGLKVIASTTWEEYTNVFEKDRALMRRFYRLGIDEPSSDVSKDILKGLRKHFEKYHNATITDEAIEASVSLSVRYQHDKRLPDKAIDLIDSACARQRMLNKRVIKINQKEIIQELSKMIKIPIDQIGAGSNSKPETNLKKIQQIIKSKLFGQDEAIDTIMDRIVIAQAGLKSIDKPICSYLLLGPTGTGKTELAKRFSENLQKKMIRFDMSEYQEKHTVSRLIGAPPGYVGYNDRNLAGGMLISQIEKNPNAIILFDEIEKSHPDVYNIFLSLMDEGFITSSGGKKVDARNCIILMTSNLGAQEEYKRAAGFNSKETNEDASLEAVEKFFSPEFRNRLDGVIKFNHLDKSIMCKIVVKFIDEINQLIESKELHLTIAQNAIEKLAEISYDPVMGARPAKRIIEEKIKIPLSKKIILKKPKPGTNIILEYKKDKFIFEFVNKKPDVKKTNLHQEIINKDAIGV